MSNAKQTGFAKLLSFGVGAEEAEIGKDKLYERYHSLLSVMCQEAEDIRTVSGLPESSAVLPKLLGYIASRRITDGFEFGTRHTEEEICHFLRGLFLGLSVETVYMLTLDAGGRVTGCEYMGEGTVNGSDVMPRRMVECAVRRGAKSVILAHNHPGGNAEPSTDDIATTSALVIVMSAAGVSLGAHYVVSGGVCKRIPV